MTSTENNLIYYFKTDTIENRDNIADMLELFGFEWLDMTGGEAGFECDGNYDLFKMLIEVFSIVNNITVYKIQKCEDMGIGLISM